MFGDWSHNGDAEIVGENNTILQRLCLKILCILRLRSLTRGGPWPYRTLPGLLNPFGVDRVPGAGTSDPSVSLAVIDTSVPSCCFVSCCFVKDTMPFPCHVHLFRFDLSKRYLSCWNCNSRGIVDRPS